MKKRTKRKPTPQESAVNELYLTVQQYVEINGGKLLVIGGIQIQEMPGDNPANFVVAVRCMGRKPTFANHQPSRADL